MRIVHLSDCHVSGLYYVPEWGDLAVDKINSLQPNLLIISGDLTDDGHLFEYEKAAEFVKRFKVKNLFIVPGNHDARNEGYKLYEEFFGGRFPLFENDEVIIQGFDSSAPDTDEGHIGRENYKKFEKIRSSKKKLKIIVLHHHVIPIPGTGREENVLTDSGDFLGLVVDCGIDFVLSGHRHTPWIWKLEKTYCITAGTATTWRLKARSNPSFNIYEIFDDSILFTEIGIVNNKIIEIKKIKINRRLTQNT